MTGSETSWRGHACAFLATLMWGVMAPLAKDAMTVFTPFMLTAFRMSGGALLFWLVSIAMRKQEHVPAKDLVRLFFAGLFAFVFNQGLFLTGLSMTTPVDAAIVTTMLPIITLIFAAVWLREPLTGLKAAGVFVGFSGALTLVVTSTDSAVGGNYKGDLLCLLAQTSFAVYLTLFKDLSHKYSSITMNKWIFTFSMLCYIPVSGGQFMEFDWSSVGVQDWMEVGYVVLFGSFFAYLLYVASQSYLRPTVVAMYNYLQPITASLLAVAMGMAVFTWHKAIAILLVFAGVYIVTHSKSREEVNKEKRLKNRTENG